MPTIPEIPNCFLCRKHAGLETQPPGGYIYSDNEWMVCHAPGAKGPLGTLFIESRRHFLDFSEMTPAEARSYGQLLQKIYPLLKRTIGAERIYTVVMLEGIPHFHAWLVPRRAVDKERGMAFLAKDIYCQEEEAARLAKELQHLLTQ